MADPFDTLEERLADVMDGAALALVHRAIDILRAEYGGERIYIGTKSRNRRQAQVEKLAAEGLKPTEIAKKVGVSPRQVRRLTSKQSSYL